MTAPIDLLQSHFQRHEIVYEGSRGVALCMSYQLSNEMLQTLSTVLYNPEERLPVRPTVVCVILGVEDLVEFLDLTLNRGGDWTIVAL